MSSIHELLKQVYPLKLRMELFNAIWFNWRADIKEKDQQITDLQNQLAITEKALETLMIMKEQLAEKDKAIENWQTMYESVVQTCHNDKEEIERLNKQLAEKEKEIEYQ